jgi:hypothetical protein
MKPAPPNQRQLPLRHPLAAYDDDNGDDDDNAEDADFNKEAEMLADVHELHEAAADDYDSDDENTNDNAIDIDKPIDGPAPDDERRAMATLKTLNQSDVRAVEVKLEQVKLEQDQKQSTVDQLAAELTTNRRVAKPFWPPSQFAAELHGRRTKWPPNRLAALSETSNARQGGWL